MTSSAVGRRAGGRIASDERGIVFDWFLKVGVWLAIIGVVLFDAGAIAVNAVTLDSTAEEMAIAISTGVSSGALQRPEEILALAEELAVEAGAKVVKAEVDETGTLRIRLRRTAKTLIVSRIGAIEDWGKSTTDAEASTN